MDVIGQIPWAHAEQALILVSGAAAIWMANDPRPAVRRWAPPVGLAGQPAWLHLAWVSGSWGVLAITLVYTAAWLRGLFTMTLRRPGHARVRPPVSSCCSAPFAPAPGPDAPRPCSRCGRHESPGDTYWCALCGTHGDHQSGWCPLAAAAPRRPTPRPR